MSQKIDKQSETVPWYERNFFWGTIGIFGMVIITVIATMKHDLRWLLVVAWPFGIAAVFAVLRGLHLRKLVSIPVGIILIGLVLLEINIWLSPKREVVTSAQQQEEPKPPKQPKSSPPIEKEKELPPNVGLRFVYPKSPALLIINIGDSVARDIKWMVVLWNTDIPDRINPLPIPTQSFDWIKGHNIGGPQNLFDTPSITPLLKPGNKLIGFATIDCPACVRRKLYIVYIIYGEGGWFSQIKQEKLTMPTDVSKDGMKKYFKELEEIVPEKSRQPIINW